MTRVVSTWVPEPVPSGDISWTLLKPGLEEFLELLPEMQVADLVFIADLRGNILDLPPTPVRIVQLLAKLGFLHGADGNTAASPAGITAPPEGIIEAAITQVLPTLAAISTAKVPKELTPEAYAVSLIRHFDVNHPKKGKISFGLDPDSADYKSALARLAERSAVQMAKCFNAGHGIARQEMFFLLGDSASRLRPMLLDALFHGSAATRSNVLRFGAPSTKPLLADKPIHSVMSEAAEALRLINKHSPLLLTIPPHSESPFAKAMGPGWALRPIVNRAGREVGIECSARNLTVGFVEALDTITDGDTVPMQLLAALLTKRTGMAFAMASRQRLVITGKHAVRPSHRTQWEILVNGERRFVTGAVLEKILAYAAAKYHPEEGFTGIRMDNPLIAGRPPKDYDLVWPASPEKAPQAVRAAVGIENFVKRKNPDRYDLVWNKDQIDAAGLKTSPGLKHAARSDSMSKLLALL